MGGLPSFPAGFPNASGGSQGVTYFSNTPTGAASRQPGAGVSNAILLLYLDLFETVTFDRIALFIQGNAVTGLSDIGIYSLAGNLLANVGAIAIWNASAGTAPAQTNFILQGKITLPAGSYIFAATTNNGAGSFTFATGKPIVIHDVYTTATVSVGGALPPTIAVTVTPLQTSNNSTPPELPCINLSV